jgi:hypothetical protein
VGAIGHTLLVLRWKDPIPLRRSWCLWEIACTLTTGSKLQVIMPPDDEAAFRAAVVDDFDAILSKLTSIDTSKADAFHAADRMRIEEAVQSQLGFTETNRRIAAAMREWMAECGKRALDALPDEDARAASELLVAFASLLSSHLSRGAEARAMLENALASRRRQFGSKSVNVFRCLRQLQTVTYLTRDQEACDAYGREEVELAAELWGKDSREAVIPQGCAETAAGLAESEIGAPVVGNQA